MSGLWLGMKGSANAQFAIGTITCYADAHIRAHTNTHTCDFIMHIMRYVRAYMCVTPTVMASHRMLADPYLRMRMISN